MNKVFLMGRLTRDPEVRLIEAATPIRVANYTLAVDRRRRGEMDRETDFIRCVAFGVRAEFAEKYMKKGTKILITGRLQTRTYRDRDGRNVNVVEVYVEDQEFAESRRSSGAATQAPTQSAPVHYATPEPTVPEIPDPVPMESEFFPSDMEGDLPFIN